MVVPWAVAQYHANIRDDYPFGERFHSSWLVAYGLLFVLTMFLFGVPGLVERARHAFPSAFLASAIPFATASAFFVVYDPLIPRFIVVVSPVIIGGIMLVASLANVSLNSRYNGVARMIAVIGDNDREAFAAALTSPPERRFITCAVVTPESVVEHGADSLLDLVAQHDATVLVLSDAAEQRDIVVSQAAHIHEQGIRVRDLSSFSDEWLGKLPVSEIRRTGMWFDIRDLHEQYYPRLKRLMDLTIAVLLLPVLAVAIPMVFVANLFGSRGGLFFAQTRVGFRGAHFEILKFRTMLPNMNLDGAGVWTAENDPRITKVGRVLRRSHLDELPQLLNVLRGDLSIVGPRPEQPSYVEKLSESIPFYGLRHSVRPGITGWAQVKYPYGASVEDAYEKLQYDLYYLRHQGLMLDLRTCVRTFSSMATGGGR